MPKKQIQTRRSVSVKGTTHQRIKKHTEASGMSVAGFIEMVIEEKLGPPTAEDRRKFGELVEARQKEAEAAKTAQKEPDAPEKEAHPAPPDPIRESAPAPAPEPTAAPEPAATEPKPQAAPKPAPEPELAGEAPAAPEPREQPLRHGGRRRKLSSGSPADELKRPKQPEEQPEGFEGYIPPIFQL